MKCSFWEFKWFIIYHSNSEVGRLTNCYEEIQALRTLIKCTAALAGNDTFLFWLKISLKIEKDL